MAQVTVTIDGKSFRMACDDGQEGRVTDLAGYVDRQMQKIAGGGAAHNDAHLLVLTTLVLADELFEARDAAQAQPAPVVQEQPSEANGALPEGEQDVLLQVIEHLAERVDAIAAKVEAA